MTTKKVSARAGREADATREVPVGPVRRTVTIVRGPSGWAVRVADIPEVVFAQYEGTVGAHPADLKGIAHEYATKALFGDVSGLIE